MSIIYDALKKSQKARSASVKVTSLRLPVIHRKQIIQISLILTCVFVIIMTLTVPRQPVTDYVFSQNASTLKPLASPTAIASAPRLMLEGVFLSENERLAMINHHTYHEGDRVSGMQIVNIAFDQVTLQNKNRSLTLRSSLTQYD